MLRNNIAQPNLEAQPSEECSVLDVDIERNNERQIDTNVTIPHQMERVFSQV